MHFFSFHDIPLRFLHLDFDPFKVNTQQNISTGKVEISNTDNLINPEGNKTEELCKHGPPHMKHI